MNFSIVPTHLAIKAMRDNGYKNAAYALAELMDNSIQAGAKHVELLCAEQTIQVGQRQRKRISQIAVLDDAKGMDLDTLQIALQFGNGTRLDPSKQDGIGRFGMGLPASSISQCQRVEVWTWQNGPENALYSYLDLDDIAAQTMTNVPAPVSKEIPALWRQVGNVWGESGTIVVWTRLDRMMWRTAAALFDNSEFIIGRMYRRFLGDGRVSIRFASFDQENPKSVTIDKMAKPNDPGYLMLGTSTPAPWDSKPMFAPWGEEESVHKIDFNGAIHEVKIRYSLATEEARQGNSPGARDYGKHAARNSGVSIVRADRELELDDDWSDASEARDRWWGIEIDFPPGLDEIFGVTNNKQNAHNFSQFANLNLDQLLSDGRSLAELREELEEDEDPRAPLIEIAHQVQKNKNVLQRLLRAQTASENRRGKHRHDPNSAETRATEVTQTRKNVGLHGGSDIGEGLPAGERQIEIETELEQQGIPHDMAKELAARTISNGTKYVITDADLDTPAFFSVKLKGGTIIVTLNTSHPAYANLVEVLDRDPSTESVEGLRARLLSASDGLKMLLMAWARHEDEQPDGELRELTQNARVNWGVLARQFLKTKG